LTFTSPKAPKQNLHASDGCTQKLRSKPARKKSHEWQSLYQKNQYAP